MRIVNGYGSAGAGNRTGRRTASNVGIGQTAAERDRRALRAESVTREGAPQADELRRYIDAGRCWWCDRDKNREGRPWQSLSLHWQRTHGISTQAVCDILGVPKHTSFVSESLRDNQAQRAKRNYNPDKLRCGKGGKKALSAFGIAANRAKFTAVRERLGEPAFRDRMKAMAQLNGERSRKLRPCIVCETTFWPGLTHNGVGGRKTCSDVCDRIRRSALAKAAWQRRDEATRNG